MTAAARSANRLATATSPYLLQHAHNPVDWYPWGEEALRRAREEDRPIFLSIGYAACHWCHVMERESFESEAIAEILNRDFVPVKVDREERPDLDEIYMTATQLMTHSGGWPMSVFLTPELKPFYAGTYFPPEDRWGRPGFKTLLTEISRAWKERRPTLEEQAERVVAAIEQVASATEGLGAVGETLVRSAVEQLARGFDPVHGGFGSAPKFPPSMRLELLLRRDEARGDGGGERVITPGRDPLSVVRLTLDRMARGGMYDQVGGGFHRYSVDERWLVPHFEKMLYDNALLSRVYALAYERTGAWYYRRVATEIFDYVIREMTHPDGGFYSTTDADSEGEEGKFFVWSPAEVVDALGREDGELFCRIYDITPAGNFEGHSIPNLLKRGLDEWAAELGTDAETLDARLAPLRGKLWERRERRVHPLLDDKILSGWNGLMIRAFAEGHRIFRDERYRHAAEKAADFVLTRMREEGRLLRSFREGKAHLNAYLEDHAYLALGLLDLHASTRQQRWCDEGLALMEQMNARFWDDEGGGYFFTSHDHEELITRVRSLQDGATPSGNSAAALALIRAARITRAEEPRRRAAHLLSLAAPQMDQMPAAVPNMLVAADEYLREWPEGVRMPGADAVGVEAFVSHTAVQPGGRFWVGVRLTIAEGHHVNSRTPAQEYLVPTQLFLPQDAGFAILRESYPRASEYRAPFQEEAVSVYRGTVILGAELQASPELEEGQYALPVTLRFQACDDQQCYPPVEARMRLPVTLSRAPGMEQHPEVFGPLRLRADA
jgi:uncharacterized protein YyaL (SSP411 family)